MLAVMRIGGNQYKVKEGDIVNVGRLADLKSGSNYIVRDVLLVAKGDKVTIGKPTISGGYIEAEVKKTFQAKKIRVAKFKAKVRYRREMGFRPQLTQLIVKSIHLPIAKERGE